MDFRKMGQILGIVFLIVAAIFWVFDLQNYYGLPYFFGNLEFIKSGRVSCSKVKRSPIWKGLCSSTKRPWPRIIKIFRSLGKFWKNSWKITNSIFSGPAW